eukprot:gene12261-18944_t
MEFEDDAGDYPVDIDGADDDDADGEDEETIVVCVRQKPLGIELKDGVIASVDPEGSGAEHGLTAGMRVIELNGMPYGPGSTTRLKAVDGMMTFKVICDDAEGSIEDATAAEEFPEPPPPQQPGIFGPFTTEYWTERAVDDPRPVVAFCNAMRLWMRSATLSRERKLSPMKVTMADPPPGCEIVHVENLPRGMCPELMVDFIFALLGMCGVRINIQSNTPKVNIYSSPYPRDQYTEAIMTWDSGAEPDEDGRIEDASSRALRRTLGQALEGFEDFGGDPLTVSFTDNIPEHLENSDPIAVPDTTFDIPPRSSVPCRMQHYFGGCCISGCPFGHSEDFVTPEADIITTRLTRCVLMTHVPEVLPMEGVLKKLKNPMDCVCVDWFLDESHPRIHEKEWTHRQNSYAVLQFKTCYEADEELEWLKSNGGGYVVDEGYHHKCTGEPLAVAEFRDFCTTRMQKTDCLSFFRIVRITEEPIEGEADNLDAPLDLPVGHAIKQIQGK